nr:MAG TPA: hypothetical protein [Microviridae sp.]
MMVIGVAYIHLRSETERERSEFRRSRRSERIERPLNTRSPSGV